MSDYEKVVDARGVVRYKLEGKFVKASEVPEDVKTSLNDVVVAEQPEVETEVAEVTVEEIDPTASPDDVDDESGIDEEITVSVAPKTDEEGMGFKRVNGKTVDIFDGKTPHESVRFTGGLVVPLTKENADTKTDGEILAQLKKIGKL